MLFCKEPAVRVKVVAVCNHPGALPGEDGLLYIRIYKSNLPAGVVNTNLQTGAPPGWQSRWVCGAKVYTYKLSWRMQGEHVGLWAEEQAISEAIPVKTGSCNWEPGCLNV